VTGARQTGKTTLVRSLEAAREHLYVTFDDLDVMEQARDAPDLPLQRAPSMILDEVQRAPDVLHAIKRLVDQRRTPGRFLLTGSASLLLMKRVSESLAGRAVYLAAWPFTRREQLGMGTAGVWPRLFDVDPKSWAELLAAEQAESEDWAALARRGGYPTPSHELCDPQDRALWFSGYVRTYLERGLQDLSAVTSLVDFRRLMRACCLRLGSLVNQTELARDVGLPQPTVRRHLDLLEASYQLVRLPAYAVNRTKRLIKAPKLYWADTGLALHLSGESEVRGAHLENGDARHLQAFRAEYGKSALPGLLLHTGNELHWLTEGILAVRWWRLI
jgi:predicted AAA+ superfamily ATPase